MALEDQRRTVVKLLTDPTFRERFYDADEGRAADFGLTVSEFRKLRKIGSEKLDIVSEGYVEKRGEHLSSVFPQTLSLMARIDEEAWNHYVESTSFCHSDEEERETFLTYLEEDFDVPDDTRRFLRDLADFERIAYNHRSSEIPSYRFTDELRPLAADDLPILEARGEFVASLEQRPLPPDDYPAAPSTYLVIREGDSLLLQTLEAERRKLLEDCDGSQTIRNLRERFGAEVETLIKNWLRAGIVRPAEREAE